MRADGTRSRRARASCALLLLAFWALPAGPLEPATPSEYEIKAAFLYNFAKFVEWPEAAAPSELDAFVITILGQDPFGGALDGVLQGKTVGGRRIVVHRANQADEAGPSQMVFISQSERAQLPQILKRFAGTATLTVGETERFAERGGVICFRTEMKRIRLDINVAAAGRARLKISSELLKLARIVDDGKAD